MSPVAQVGHHHPHAGAHQPEVLPEASGPGTVLVDIGGDIGAAAVQVPEYLDGSELEIRRVGDEWAGIHVAVRERPVGGRSIYAAFFPALECGDYDIRLKDDASQCLGRFTVSGGAVTRYVATGTQ